MKRFNEFSKMNESSDNEKEYTYVGTCVNSFDRYGECKNDAFTDTQDFFQSWETAKEITSEEFWKHIDPHSQMYTKLKRIEAKGEYETEYRYSKENDVYFAFVNDDTHYFFIK